MGFSKVLIPLDGTPLAELALKKVELVAQSPAHIHLFSVITTVNVPEMTLLHTSIRVPVMPDTPPQWYNASQPNALQSAVNERQEYLKRVAGNLEAAGFNVTIEVETGDAATMIAGVLTKGFDLVIMATHQRTGLSKLLLGSVAEHVLKESPCPVLIVPGKPH